MPQWPDNLPEIPDTYLGQTRQPDQPSASPGPRTPLQPDVSSEKDLYAQKDPPPLSAGAGLGRGVDLTQALVGGAIEVSGEITGIDRIADAGERMRKRNVAEMEENPRSAEFQDVLEDPAEFPQWAKEVGTENLPMMGTMVAGGGAGFLVGGPIGAVVGALAPLVFGVGEAQLAIKGRDPEMEAPWYALSGGVLIAALDRIVPGKLGGHLVARFGRKPAEAIVKQALAKPLQSRFVQGAATIGSKTVQGMSTEAITEALQEVVGEVNAALATGTDMDWDEMGRQALEAGAAGGLVGTGTGAVTGATDIRRAPPPEAPTAPPLEVTPETGPEVTVEAEPVITPQPRPIPTPEVAPGPPVAPMETEVPVGKPLGPTLPPVAPTEAKAGPVPPAGAPSGVPAETTAADPGVLPAVVGMAVDGPTEAPKDVSALRGLVARYGEQTSPYVKNDTDQSARFTPATLYQLRRIRDELEEFKSIAGFTVYDEYGPGVTVERRTPPSPRARVAEDIEASSHRNRNAKSSATSYKRIVDAVNVLLKPGQSRVHNNVAEGALRVAEMREANDFTDIQQPQLEKPFDETFKDTSEEQVTSARKLRQAWFDADEASTKADARVREVKRDQDSDNYFRDISAAEEASEQADAESSEARDIYEAALNDLSEEQRAQLDEGDVLKTLFRELARRVHPDLATNDGDRERRTRAMAEVNRAYKDSDEAQLRAILGEWEASPDATPDVDVLKTGESQVRLPEAGKVRDVDVDTPEVADLPFSLQPEAGVPTTGEVAAQQPALNDISDAEAQYNLGLKYSEGRGVPQDDAQAVALWRKAADQGHANAQYELGIAYYDGQGVPQDDAQAAAWWRKAADQGHPDGQQSLGFAYRRGVGVPQDEDQAEFWLRKAKSQSIAQGRLLDDGEADAQDDEGARPMLGGGDTTAASRGEFAEFGPDQSGKDDIRPAEFPELVLLARELLKHAPKVMKRFRGAAGTLGLFRGSGGGSIELLADLFKQGNEFKLAATLAHEIGHVVDWLPQETLARGNLLGRLQSLRKFMGSSFSLPGHALAGKFALRPADLVIRNKDILAELKAFSREWRPWNPETASKQEKLYRNSARELYADALSGLLIRPGLLRTRAPKFYEAFFALLENKPDVKARYFEIQNLLSQPRTTLVAQRHERLIEGFRQGEETALELQAKEEARRKNEGGIVNAWERIKRELVDLARPLERLYEKHNVPEHARLTYMLEEKRYLGGVLKAFTAKHMDPILAAINPDIGMDAFGSALVYERIISGDRSDIANPTGISPSTAAEQYAHLKEELGPEKTKILETQLGRFQEMVQVIAEDGYKSGLYSDAMYESMRKNPAYATFQVVEYMDKDLSARVYNQKGTLLEIANPAWSTFIKTLAIIGEIERNNSRRKIVEGLQEFSPEEVTPAKVSMSTRDDGGIVRTFTMPPRGEGIVEFKAKGVTQGYYLDWYVANAIQYESPRYNSLILEVITRMNSAWFRPLFTMINVGFMAANSRRDWSRFYKNNPKMTIAKSIRLYIEAVPMARARALGPPKNPTPKEVEAQELLLATLGHRMLSNTWEDVVKGQEDADVIFERILRQAGAPGMGGPLPKPYLKPLLAAIDAVFNLGTFIETLPKAAQVYYLTEENREAGMSPEEAVSKITPEERRTLRRDIGSPDFLQLTGWKPLTNNIALYSDSMVQGMRSDLRVSTDPSHPKTMGLSGWWWKTIGIDVVPKLFMVAALYGWLGDELKRFYERVTEYDRTNYTPIPLWWTNMIGPVTYFRMPHGDSGRLIGALAYKSMIHTLEGRNAAQGLVAFFDLAAGQIPSLTPPVSAVVSTVEMARGGNPRDSFRQRDLLSRQEQEARGWPAWKKFFGWSFQNLGGSTFWKFYPGERLPQKKTRTQTFLDLPMVAPLLGRFIRSTDYGDTERLLALLKEGEQEKAQGRQRERSAVYDIVQRVYTGGPEGWEGKNFTEEELNAVALGIVSDAWPDDPVRAAARYTSQDIQKEIKESVAGGMAGAFLREWMNARTKPDRGIIVREWMRALGVK